jgi:hypothetical protein
MIYRRRMNDEYFTRRFRPAQAIKKLPSGSYQIIEAYDGAPPHLQSGCLVFWEDDYVSQFFVIDENSTIDQVLNKYLS